MAGPGGNDAHAAERIGMTDGRQRQQAVDEAPHAIAKDPAVLAASRQRAIPEASDLEPKRVQRRLVHGVGIEFGRPRGSWRFSSLALSIARRGHISTMATFPEAPLRSRKVGFPESGSDLGFPSQAFPLARKLKCDFFIYYTSPV